MTDPESLRRIVAEVRKYYADNGWPDELWAMGLDEAVKFATHFHNLGALEERSLSPQQARNDVLQEVIAVFLRHHAATQEQADFANAILRSIRALKSAPPSEPKP